MQWDKETKLKQEKERCRQLAQRIAEEVHPGSAAVLNAESDLLEKALRRVGIRANAWAEGAEPADLLVVVDPAWGRVPAQLAEKVLLVSEGSTVMAGWAEQLAAAPKLIRQGLDELAERGLAGDPEAAAQRVSVNEVAS